MIIWRPQAASTPFCTTRPPSDSQTTITAGNRRPVGGADRHRSAILIFSASGRPGGYPIGGMAFPLKRRIYESLPLSLKRSVRLTIASAYRDKVGLQIDLEVCIVDEIPLTARGKLKRLRSSLEPDRQSAPARSQRA